MSPSNRNKIILSIQTYFLSQENLSEWNALENSDSPTIETGDWGQVEELSSQANRDWEDLKSKLEQGTMLEAPIVMKFGGRHHLVAGNTRLMVCRAMGIAPKVLLFEIDV